MPGLPPRPPNETKHTLRFPLHAHLGSNPRPRRAAGPTKRETATAAVAPGAGTAHTGSASGTSERPGALQEHRGGPRHKRTLTRRDGTATALPGAGKRAAHAACRPPERTGQREAFATSRGPHRARSGPESAPPPSTHYRQAGKRDEGPTGRTRRAVPFAMNVRPSPGAALARPRRARSHHIDRLRRRKGGPRERVSRRGPFSPRSLLRPHQPRPPGRAADDTERGTPDTRHGAMETGVVTIALSGAHGGEGARW